MFGFKNNKDLPQSAQQIAVREYKPTHKKKNTYKIEMSTPLYNPTLFQLCQTTPMPVDQKNGTEVSRDTWRTCVRFPTYGAQKMIKMYKHIQPVMGDVARTIVEYLDKESGKPVAYLFPTDLYCMADLSRLNHASRQDLNKQIRIRENMLEILNQNNR